MYYVPDETERCGYYECENYGSRFLDIKIGPSLVCPFCGEQPDMEIGPDEEMPVIKEDAKLVKMLQGTEGISVSSCINIKEKPPNKSKQEIHMVCIPKNRIK